MMFVLGHLENMANQISLAYKNVHSYTIIQMQCYTCLCTHTHAQALRHRRNLMNEYLPFDTGDEYLYMKHVTPYN